MYIATQSILGRLENSNRFSLNATFKGLVPGEIYYLNE